jgi:hypothetical protein
MPQTAPDNLKSDPGDQVHSQHNLSFAPLFAWLMSHIRMCTRLTQLN